MANLKGLGTYEAIVIGAGHNGLVTGALLARAGLRTLILERRERAGGAIEVSQTIGRLRPSVIRSLRLHDHGLRFIHPTVRVFAPQPDGRALTIWADAHRTAEGLRVWSARDADAYAGFDRKVRAIASFIARLNASTPPDLKSPSAADAISGLRLARAFRGLGGPHQVRETIRVLPMAVADLVGEAFETDALRGALATRGVRYTAMGPWSAGTAAVLLNDSAGNDGGAGGQTVFARGGSSAVSDALVSAAKAFGAEIRCGAEVARIATANGRVAGVALSSGEELAARIVASGADPKRTLLGMVDPMVLGPSLAWRAANIRTPGTVATVDLTLAGAPRFAGLGRDGEAGEALHGRIVIAPGVDYLERAFDASKYGGISEAPYLEATIPSLFDPALALSDGAHRMNVLVQWAPYRLRQGDWDGDAREKLGDLVVATLEAAAPGFVKLVTGLEVKTPVDLEREFGLTGGHPLHAEPGLDQFFAWRPLLGHARYRMPVEGLYLCGSGAHPGGGITGEPGANAAREILADRGKRGN